MLAAYTRSLACMRITCLQVYGNNRTNSFVSNGSLVILPTLTADVIGWPNVQNGFTLDINGGDPSSYCTSASSYGCLRTSGAGGNYLNPVQSVRLRTAETFAFTYGRVEFNAKLPKGDWQWPALWLMPSRGEYGGWPASGEIDVMEVSAHEAAIEHTGEQESW